eukprot:40078-Amphidinium_carterae.1
MCWASARQICREVTASLIALVPSTANPSSHPRRHSSRVFAERAIILQRSLQHQASQALGHSLQGMRRQRVRNFVTWLAFAVGSLGYALGLCIRPVRTTSFGLRKPR